MSKDRKKCATSCVILKKIYIFFCALVLSKKKNKKSEKKLQNFAHPLAAVDVVNRNSDNSVDYDNSVIVVGGRSTR